MTLLEEIHQRLNRLPPEKQSEVLDFIEFIYQRTVTPRPGAGISLKKHPAFGS